MRNIEIFIEDAKLLEVIEWLIEYFYVDSKKDITENHFILGCRSDSISCSVEVKLEAKDRKYTHVIFDSTVSVWASSEDCAADAHRFMSKIVLSK